jgi:hypothetical protein
MSAVEVVKALIAEGIVFSTHGQRITWCNDDGWMKPEVIAIIKEGRAEVIRYLVNLDQEARR